MSGQESAAQRPAADGAQAAELSAEETARLHEALGQVPYARLLGLEFVGARRGEATFALEAAESLMRMGGIVHGGAVVSLMDSAAAFAVHTLLEPGRNTVTVDLTVHFLRPAVAGRVEARARVLRDGRRVVILSVEATNHAGELIATATMTYYKQG